MREKEYKHMLNETQYLKILEYLQYNYQIEFKININYFFDTPNLDLSKKGITLRVRQINSKLVLDIKMPGVKNGYLIQREEISKEIKEFPIFINLRNLPIYEIIPDVKGAQLIGTLVTERYSCKVQEGIIIDLDKSSYLGALDYELEVEFHSDFEKEAYGFFQKLIGDLKRNEKVIGKKSRFIRRLCSLQSTY
ncbi:CYTH domain-containing protein [Bacillus cereus group sp. N21]|uniref:CYTH domain-containing protein n=1 Tax=Bacillus cereus group sp. N21 TaxID=2794591 RepID=UPI0018F3ADCB|nr:CYTH domain-containing protein [Bacillus cereus group sp. N21]MBJ8030401.1 CYTH domain-containing protein [Bacillus cereus group sp. N21]